MPRYYIPARDPDFEAWIVNYLQYAAANAAALGLSPAQVLELQTDKINWSLAFNNNNAAQAAAQSAKAMKDQRRQEVESVIQALTNYIQSRPQTTDAQRQALGITVPDREPTPTDPTAITRVLPPILWGDTQKPRVVTLHFGTNPQDERLNAKPVEAYGARIWGVEGGPPAGPGGWDALAWTWLGDDTSSPYTHNVGRAATFSYRAQWFDQLMNLGPLGDPITCAVTG
jgi:hypothetical protein